MIPIFEQGPGRGIGHSLEGFVARFDEICLEHLKQKRALAFAFIFYDRSDETTRHLLHNQGVFTQLDRLSGTNLSIFYLHTGSERAVEHFNAGFLSLLGVEETARTPCVVFFRVESDRLEDIKVVSLDNSDLIHGFHELYEVIRHYIEGTLPTMKGRYLRWMAVGGKFVSLEVFRAALRKVLSLFIIG